MNNIIFITGFSRWVVDPIFQGGWMDGWILRVLSLPEALFRNKRVVCHFWVGSFGNV